MTRLLEAFSRALGLPSYHRDAAHDAISAELVRLTLPHHPSTDRPDLRLDLA